MGHASFLCLFLMFFFSFSFAAQASHTEEQNFASYRGGLIIRTLTDAESDELITQMNDADDDSDSDEEGDGESKDSDEKSSTNDDNTELVLDSAIDALISKPKTKKDAKEPGTGDEPLNLWRIVSALTISDEDGSVGSSLTEQIKQKKYNLTAIMDLISGQAKTQALKSKDEQGRTALHWAALYGLTGIVQRILENDPDRVVVNIMDDDGATALALVLENKDIGSQLDIKYLATIAALLAAGGTVFEKNDGEHLVPISEEQLREKLIARLGRDRYGVMCNGWSVERGCGLNHYERILCAYDRASRMVAALVAQ